MKTNLTKIFILLLLAMLMCACDDDAVGKEISGTVLDTKQVSCPEELVATERGSVGFMKNLAESPDSIKAIADKQLRAAFNADRDAIEKRVRYRVEPLVFIPTSEQKPRCLVLEEQTQVHPLEFEPKSFKSISKLNDWIMDFSRGQGDDGKKLYEQCNLNCSPRYTFDIVKNSTNFNVSTLVHCGLGRDTSSDQYQLSTSIITSCEVD
jgi:hypothetical protein